jgi:hypothetical protein
MTNKIDMIATTNDLEMNLTLLEVELVSASLERHVEHTSKTLRLSARLRFSWLHPASCLLSLHK